MGSADQPTAARNFDESEFRRTVGWKPRVGLREGLERTVAYYRQHFAHYVDEVSSPAQGLVS